MEVANKGFWGYGGTLGVYAGGWNFDGSYQFSGSGQSELVVLRTGWGFGCGKNLLLTPQIGWGGCDFSCAKHSSGDFIFVLPISCRTQYCLTKIFAINLTTEYLIPLESLHSGMKFSRFYLRAGLVLNLDLTNLF